MLKNHFNKNMTEKNNSFIFHSFQLILSRISLGLSGFLFWLVATNLYSIENIGLGAVLISVCSLIVFFSSLGTVPTLVRFLPEDKNAEDLAGTLIGFSLLILFLLYLIFYLTKNLTVPSIAILKQPFIPFVFCMFIFLVLVFQILEGIFISFKDLKLVLIINLIQNFVRIGLLFLLGFWGGFGIFSSNAISALLAIGISLVYFTRKYPDFRPRLRINFRILRRILPFSMVNFLYAFSLTLPGMIFPIIILRIYSEREAGLFYIPWMIFSVYCTFIISINGVFLMQASHGENIKKLLKNAVLYSLILGITGCLIFIFYGDRLLLIFKKDFAGESFEILKILFYSIFFYIINQIYITTLNIKKNVLKVGILSMIILSSVVLFTILLISNMGGEGAALAWLISHFLGNVFVLGSMHKRKTKIM
ncbi:MAG: hypothetical protein A2161_21470 [Candidatus Schekmanbacteria bacterium RBG_13_48_7]|uniref:Polysaccharide biosynthesis protein C-terminal domain-containing protein n=1 Tax=Candidatus Schekmanbacteria bacterium RBG_13_48_7 TaxID=1817878 RepID=A0A1F7RPT9_9BACT|nr:MAG: hypothetical protein A2161_21470 [Candidatus Schekmanbacteria bacterium RBG_13_48_7]